MAAFRPASIVMAAEKQRYGRRSKRYLPVPQGRGRGNSSPAGSAPYPRANGVFAKMNTGPCPSCNAWSDRIIESDDAIPACAAKSSDAKRRMWMSPIYSGHPLKSAAKVLERLIWTRDPETAAQMASSDRYSATNPGRRSPQVTPHVTNWLGKTPPGSLGVFVNGPLRGGYFI